MKPSRKKELYAQYCNLNLFRLWLVDDKDIKAYKDDYHRRSYNMGELEYDGILKRELAKHSIHELEYMCDNELNLFFRDWYNERMPQDFQVLKTKLDAIHTNKVDTEEKLKQRRDDSLTKIIKATVGNEFELMRVDNNYEIVILIANGYYGKFRISVGDFPAIYLDDTNVSINVPWSKYMNENSKKTIMGWEAAIKFYNNTKAVDDLRKTLEQYFYDMDDIKAKAEADTKDVMQNALDIINREYNKVLQQVMPDYNDLRCYLRSSCCLSIEAKQEDGEPEGVLEVLGHELYYDEGNEEVIVDGKFWTELDYELKLNILQNYEYQVF